MQTIRLLEILFLTMNVSRFRVLQTYQPCLYPFIKSNLQYHLANGINSDWESQKKNIWSMVALESEDQLRQRMAWALSQILVVAPNQVSTRVSFFKWVCICLLNSTILFLNARSKKMVSMCDFSVHRKSF